MDDTAQQQQGDMHKGSSQFRQNEGIAGQRLDAGRPLSVGEHRVRTQFNPSSSGVVDEIKQASARLIDLCEGLKTKDPRLAALAQTSYEDACMWAVKAATA